MGDELGHETIMILESDDALVFVARRRRSELDAFMDEAVDPEPDGAWRDCERCHRDLTGSLTSAPGVRPREKSQNRSGVSFSVAEIKMVRRGIVEVDCALHEAQAKNSGVEVYVTLRIFSDSSEVMNAGGGEAQETVSVFRCSVILRVPSGLRHHRRIRSCAHSDA